MNEQLTKQPELITGVDTNDSLGLTAAKAAFGKTVKIPVLPHRKGRLVTNVDSPDYMALQPDGTFDF